MDSDWEMTVSHGRPEVPVLLFGASSLQCGVLIFLLPLKGLKQLRWEAERDDWLHNRDVKSIIKKKKNFKKRRPKTTQKIKKQRK